MDSFEEGGEEGKSGVEKALKVNERFRFRGLEIISVLSNKRERRKVPWIEGQKSVY